MPRSHTVTDQPRVVPLDAPRSGAATVGAKAANLAHARARGLPVLDGFTIPPAMIAALVTAPSADSTEAVESLRTAWGALSGQGRAPVVVRSSSAAEDTETSSQAGVFESVVDVHGWDAFLDAVRTVARSAARTTATSGSPAFAVLVQRHVDPVLSGVLFTTDPVTGRSDRLAVAVVEGGPQALVSGEVSGIRLALDRHARVVEGPRRGHPLRWRHRLALVRLARRAESIFGGPQDIEWAVDGVDRMLLLQSRPITTASARTAGPVLGPGPVAETFPDPLRPLEQELWLGPLRDALRLVLELTGSANRRMLDRSPVLIAVDGRAAVDLELLEGGRTRRRGVALLDPRPPVRRLRVAWRVGRLRSALPSLIDDVIARLDADLAAVPPLASLDDEQLLVLMRRASDSLRAAHGHELLAGMLATDSGSPAAAVALRALADGRRAGATDAEIVAADPAVLALTAPAIGAGVVLPAGSGVPEVAPVVRAPLGRREALRLRIRWLHELSARAAWELGARQVAAGRLPRADDIAGTDLATLTRAVRAGAAIVAPPVAGRGGAPLPDRFRMAVDGSVVAVRSRGGGSEGAGAGGGRGAGTVAHGSTPPPGSVLVVGTLDPRLAPVLPTLAGLVAATGSPLSHLAILAREHGVPTVVGVPEAPDRFPPGTELLVDGTTGEVRVLASASGQGPVPT
jgi:rifampicin phosphotransferase